MNVPGHAENVAHWRGALSVSSRFSSGAIAEIALEKRPTANPHGNQDRMIAQFQAFWSDRAP